MEIQNLSSDSILLQLAEVMETRRLAAPSESYVSQLLHAGQDKILKKVIEEAGEVLMASKDGDNSHLVKEIADLWFHTLVLLTHHGLRPEDVLAELRQRQNRSGLAEKAARQN
ncbi:phosphoribosyl-ATP diphosphatase [Stenoxybacter acetivorans]|uniref:phosphoribosyl-ATP diphosphatase n=1 Tax=Stenoxybacter acetivorans TaxID=422441 RepID=UPI00055F7DE6|nr:phosphoribosyl-ATP diphosphatase [Stenoxybacter acetivorans]